MIPGKRIRNPASFAAGKALTGGTGDFGRVSLGGGFWTALFGCYCYVYLAAMRMKPGTLSRSVFLLAAPAGILLLFVSGCTTISFDPTDLSSPPLVHKRIEAIVKLKTP